GDPRVVANAVEGIERLGGASGARVLRAAADHPHPRVRANALLALGRRGDAEALDALERWREVAEPTARASARWAWERLQEGSLA
ncbi:MAG: HEAT repeat domain-containing protein, partial [Planctomycetota bacterium]